jgi:hypothetical protein
MRFRSASVAGLPRVPPKARMRLDGPCRICARVWWPDTQDADYSQAKSTLASSLVSRGLLLREEVNLVANHRS